jgi:hypothetical protein
MPIRLLRVALIVRCAANAAFAWFLIATTPATQPALAHAFAPFAAIDGALALSLALLVLAAHWHAGIALVAAIDGVIRIAAALVLWLGPGTPYFPLTVVLFVGVLATLSFSLGLLELGEARRLRGQVGRNPISAALAVAGIATIALAVVAFFAMPDAASTRRWLTIGALVEAATLLAVALAVTRPQRTRP